jgi:hypothetical protein
LEKPPFVHRHRIRIVLEVVRRHAKAQSERGDAEERNKKEKPPGTAAHDVFQLLADVALFVL